MYIYIYDSVLKKTQIHTNVCTQISNQCRAAPRAVYNRLRWECHMGLLKQQAVPPCEWMILSCLCRSWIMKLENLSFARVTICQFCIYLLCHSSTWYMFGFAKKQINKFWAYEPKFWLCHTKNKYLKKHGKRQPFNLNSQRKLTVKPDPDTGLTSPTPSSQVAQCLQANQSESFGDPNGHQHLLDSPEGWKRMKQSVLTKTQLDGWWCFFSRGFPSPFIGIHGNGIN